ncbi:MAG: hypothetical protein Fur0011_1400 [Candidatus Microgenomates bacterium]
MAKSKKRAKLYLNPTLLFLVITLVISVFLVLIRVNNPAQPSEIFLVDSSTLPLGETQLRGTIRQSGDVFLLITNNNLAIELNIRQLEPLVDVEVEVEGYLSKDSYHNYIMSVKNIKSLE